MRSVIIVLMLLCVGFTSYGQSEETKTKRQLRREAKKEKWKKAHEDRKKEYELRLDQVKQMLDSGSYIVECHMVMDRIGDSYPVAPSINFFAVDGGQSTLQIGADNGSLGPNGIGGITVDGRVRSYVVRHRKQSSYARMNVMTSFATLTVTVTVNGSGNTTVDVRGNWGNRVRMSGIIKPLEENTVFKGTPII